MFEEDHNPDGVSMSKPEFRRRFLQLLKDKGVAEKSVPYYQRRLEDWGRVLRGGREMPREILLAEWISGLGGNPRWQEFQIRQAMRAVRWAHGEILGEEWVRRVDWRALDNEVARQAGEGVVLAKENREEFARRLGAGGFSRERVEVLVRLLEVLRGRSYAYRTEESYLSWAMRFLGRAASSPGLPGPDEAELFLERLAVEAGVAPATQKQALSALVFLFREGLGVATPRFGHFQLAREKKRVPVVLSKAEVRTVLGGMDGVWGLMAELLYGTGMRLMEGVRLRVKDVDFDQGMVIVRQGKGRKDRRTPLPKSLEDRQHGQLAEARRLHESDRAAGLAGVWMPEALERKAPAWGREWGWF